MRKFAFLGLLIIFSLFISSCSITGNITPQRNTAQPNNNVKFLNPEELFGKKLVGFSMTGRMTVGIDRNSIFRLRVNDDGTFELKVNEGGFNGTWSFDINAKPYRYVFEWFDGGEKQGFNMDFFGTRNEIIWMGKQFEPDVDKIIGFQFTFEE